MKKLRKIDGSCAVIALHHASGIAEDTVLRVCKLHDFTPEDGMEDECWQEAAHDLGLIIRNVGVADMRLKTFVSKFKKGLYLVGTHDHLFVVDNGLIVDPREKDAGRYPGHGRIVKAAWKVINTNEG